MQYNNIFNPKKLSVIEAEVIHQERTGKVLSRVARLEYRYKFTQSEKIFFRIRIEAQEPKSKALPLVMNIQVDCLPLAVKAEFKVTHGDSAVRDKMNGKEFAKIMAEWAIKKVLEQRNALPG